MVNRTGCLGELPQNSLPTRNWSSLKLWPLLCACFYHILFRGTKLFIENSPQMAQFKSRSAQRISSFPLLVCYPLLFVLV